MVAMLQHFSEVVATPAGRFQFTATRRGISGIKFPRQFKHAPRATKTPLSVRKTLNGGKRFLRSYFSRTGSPSPAARLDWTGFTIFEKQVLRKLKETPAGHLITYAELAKKCGRSGAARAVGSVLKRNSIPIFLPCHRVIRSNQSLGGFSCGLKWKKRLIELEKQPHR